MSGIELPSGIRLINPSPVDIWAGPYKSITEANATILNSVRYKSMLVHITSSNKTELYWYKDGIRNEDLVPFSEGHFITDATGYIRASGSIKVGTSTISNNPSSIIYPLLQIGDYGQSKFYRDDLSSQFYGVSTLIIGPSVKPLANIMSTGSSTIYVPEYNSFAGLFVATNASTQTNLGGAITLGGRDLLFNQITPFARLSGVSANTGVQGDLVFETLEQQINGTRTGFIEKMRIKYDGKIAINNNNPLSIFHINDKYNNTPGLIYQYTDVYTILGNTKDGNNFGLIQVKSEYNNKNHKLLLNPYGGDVIIGNAINNWTSIISPKTIIHGNLGIGQDIADYRLDINGSIHIKVPDFEANSNINLNDQFKLFVTKDTDITTGGTTRGSLDIFSYIPGNITQCLTMVPTGETTFYNNVNVSKNLNCSTLIYKSLSPDISPIEVYIIADSYLLKLNTIEVYPNGITKTTTTNFTLNTDIEIFSSLIDQFNAYQYLIIGGGGGGGGSVSGTGRDICGGGGGGAAALVYIPVIPEFIKFNSIIINIGSGGSGGSNVTNATNGNDSYISFNDVLSTNNKIISKGGKAGQQGVITSLPPFVIGGNDGNNTQQFKGGDGGQGGSNTGYDGQLGSGPGGGLYGKGYNPESANGGGGGGGGLGILSVFPYSNVYSKGGKGSDAKPFNTSPASIGENGMYGGGGGGAGAYGGYGGAGGNGYIAIRFLNFGI